MSSDDKLAQRLEAIPDIDFTIMGKFVRFDGVVAVVDVGAQRVTMPNVGMYFPIPGDDVRIIRVGKQTLLWGPAVARSPIGRVSGSGSPRCTVEYPAGSGVSLLMGYPKNITPAVNDVVLIDWTSGGTIIDTITAAPVTVAPDDPSGGAGQSGRQTFTAIDSGSFGSSWFTNAVFDSTSNSGAWFYGSKIADTIPDGASITSMSIYLPLQSGSGFAPNIRGHTSATRPGGNVAFTGGSHTLGAISGWVGIPTSLGDLLKANAFGLGFAANSGGYNIWSGVGSDGLSGALDIAWTA